MHAPAALNTAFANGDTTSVVVETLAAEGVTGILDIGCGKGALAKALTARNFSVTGVEPSKSALAMARKTAPDAKFLQGVAEALPVESAGFDAVVFLNSLHHVPVSQMPTALHEAVRVVRPGGPIVIVEPIPEGPFYALLRLVDDETDIRNAAGRAVADAVRDSLLELRGNVVYERRERLADMAALIDRLCSVNPDRRATAEDRRQELEKLFEENAVVEDGMHVLAHPHRIYLLRAPE